MIRGGAYIRPDKQLEVEPEEKLSPKMLQLHGPPPGLGITQEEASFHCKDTSLCELTCGNVIMDRKLKSNDDIASP